MRRIDFNKDWKYSHLEESGSEKSITLPHDAMLSEKRTKESVGQKS